MVGGASLKAGPQSCWAQSSEGHYIKNWILTPCYSGVQLANCLHARNGVVSDINFVLCIGMYVQLANCLLFCLLSYCLTCQSALVSL